MGFKNAVDKDAIPTVSILGVNIAAIDMEWLLSFTETNVKELSGDYICVSNVHSGGVPYVVVKGLLGTSDVVS